MIGSRKIKIRAYGIIAIWNFYVKHLHYFSTYVPKLNLVLKLSKHVDYTLICNRVQRHILFVTSKTATTKLSHRTQPGYWHQKRYEMCPSTCLERTLSVTAC